MNWIRLILLPLPTDDRQERAAAWCYALAAMAVVTVVGGLAVRLYTGS